GLGLSTRSTAELGATTRCSSRADFGCRCPDRGGKNSNGGSESCLENCLNGGNRVNGGCRVKCGYRVKCVTNSDGGGAAPAFLFAPLFTRFPLFNSKTTKPPVPPRRLSSFRRQGRREW